MEKQLQEIIDRSELTVDEISFVFRFVVAAEELFMPWLQSAQEVAAKKDAAVVKELFKKLREVSAKLRTAAKQS